jgi:hypothetical protein
VDFTPDLTIELRAAIPKPGAAKDIQGAARPPGKLVIFDFRLKTPFYTGKDSLINEEF